MADMKIILRSDVENLGTLGDVVVVRAGYARNYLLPQGHAMVATPANLKVFDLEKKKLQAKMDALRGAANDLCARIEAANVVINMRVGDNDKLYGSVTSSMIAAHLEEQNIEIDRHRILLDSPIRTLGEFEIRVRLHAGVIAKLKVNVAHEERIIYDAEPVAQKSEAEVSEDAE